MSVPPGSAAAAQIREARQRRRELRQEHRDRVRYFETKVAELGEMKPADVVIAASGLAIARALCLVADAILEAGRS